MTQQYLQYEVYELEQTAAWRAGKAQEWPDDRRNQLAAERCERLAQQLREAPDSEREAFEHVCGELFGDATDTTQIVKDWSDYRSRVGFDHIPDRDCSRHQQD